LFEATNKTGDLTVEQLCQWVINRINENEFLNTEYFEIVNEATLLPVKSWDEDCNKVGCIAVHCGKIRLIDNVKFQTKI
jgi:pantoate--beta-alanine ligase